MKEKILRIASRKSPLALWQAHHVASVFAQHYPEWGTEVIPLTTTGDTLLDQPLSESGGKGLFVKELEQALFNHTADIAVHSMKDVPATLPEGLVLAAILPREDPADAFVSNRFVSLAQLPDAAVIGTSSLRRRCQLAHHYPNLVIKPLRGNVETRLARLDDNQFDAIVLACAGLKRLGHSKRIRERIPLEISLPAIGQGALGIECRAEDTALCEQMEKLHDMPTFYCVSTERFVSLQLGGDCQLPIAAHAERHNKIVHLRALVGSPDGKKIISAQAQSANPHTASLEVTTKLTAQGATQILAACHDKPH